MSHKVKLLIQDPKVEHCKLNIPLLLSTITRPLYITTVIKASQLVKYTAG